MPTVRDRARCVSVQDYSRELAVTKALRSLRRGTHMNLQRINHLWGLGAFPELLLSRPSELSGAEEYRTRFDCQFARHFSHPHGSFSVRV